MRKIVLMLLIIINVCDFAPAMATPCAVRDFMRSKGADGKKIVSHKVQKGETFYSISRHYKVPVKEIMKANKGVAVLKEGQIINIPTTDDNSAGAGKGGEEHSKPPMDKKYVHKSTEKKPVSEATAGTVMHTVKKGETVYGISKKYGASVHDVVAWNNIKSNTIEAGQRLVVSKSNKTEEIINAAAQPVEKKISESTLPSNASTKIEEPEKSGNQDAHESEIKKSDEIADGINHKVIDKTLSGKKVVQSVETGEAAWVSDNDLNPNKYFALHRTAPPGTIMKVTNRMNGKYVFVKVVGRLPGTGDNEKLIIKISKAAAERIGVLDQTFQCELNYAFAEE